MIILLQKGSESRQTAYQLIEYIKISITIRKTSQSVHSSNPRDTKNSSIL